MMHQRMQRDPHGQTVLAHNARQRARVVAAHPFGPLNPRGDAVDPVAPGGRLTDQLDPSTVVILHGGYGWAATRTRRAHRPVVTR